MKEIGYDFVNFDGIEQLQVFGNALGGVLKKNALYFDNEIANGKLSLLTPEKGIWIRKWQLTTFKKVVLHKLPAPEHYEKKVLLIYFLNPSIFSLKNKTEKIKVNGAHNNILLTSDIAMDFSVMLKQPFYVLDIALTTSWLFEHFKDAAPPFKETLHRLINNMAHPVMVEPCSIEEYKIVHDLEQSMQGDNENLLFVRSRIYCLIASFFSKLINHNWSDVIRNTVHYEQIMWVEQLITENTKKLPNLTSIAKEVNMSVSTLLRQFKLIYKKSIHQYYVAKKMELAKKMILENSLSVKEMAAYLGYKHASAFIESFTKYHGYSPGRLSLISD